MWLKNSILKFSQVALFIWLLEVDECGNINSWRNKVPPHEEPIRPRTCEAEKIVTNILKKLLTSYLFLNIKYLCFHVNTNKTVALYLLNRSFKLILCFSILTLFLLVLVWFSFEVISFERSALLSKVICYFFWYFLRTVFFMLSSKGSSKTY